MFIELTNIKEAMLCWNLVLNCFKTHFQILASVLCGMEAVMKSQVDWNMWQHANWFQKG